MDNNDYYEVLGVEKGAEAGEIKRAYRKVALKYHPDRNPSADAEDRFKMAAEAYEVLRDPEKRRVYDAYGKAGLQREGFAGFDDVGDIFSNLGSIFGDIFGFGGRGRQRGPVRGRDLNVVLSLSLQEAATGVEREVAVQRPVPCDPCGGTGAQTPEDVQVCPDCRGTGQLTHAQGFMMLSTTCTRCGGRGQIIRRVCESCRGKGQAIHSDSLKVRVPEGIDQGERLRVRGAGEVAAGGAGDLYIEIRLEPDPDLERHGHDIHSVVDVDMADAALGTEVTVRGLMEEIKISIPEGTQPAATLRQVGKGMPRRDGYGSGDHIVHIRVVVPRKLNRKQRRNLKDYLASGG
jgi:molecular chaperone DnaJ